MLERCLCHSPSVEARRQCPGQSFPSTMWVLGTKLTSPSMRSRALSHWANATVLIQELRLLMYRILSRTHTTTTVVLVIRVGETTVTIGFWEWQQLPPPMTVPNSQGRLSKNVLWPTNLASPKDLLDWKLSKSNHTPTKPETCTPGMVVASCGPVY